MGNWNLAVSLYSLSLIIYCTTIAFLTWCKIWCIKFDVFVIQIALLFMQFRILCKICTHDILHVLTSAWYHQFGINKIWYSVLNSVGSCHLGAILMIWIKSKFPYIIWNYSVNGNSHNCLRTAPSNPTLPYRFRPPG